MKSKLTVIALAGAIGFAAQTASAASKKYCYKFGGSTCVTSTATTGNGNSGSNAATTPPVAGKLELVNGAYKDGLTYKTCAEVKAKHADAVTGIYDLNGSKVYCEMTLEGGGWTLVGYTNGDLKGQSVKLFKNKNLAKNETIESLTYSPTTYPVLPSGGINKFEKGLFVGGTTNWKQRVGDWVSFELQTQTNPGYMSTVLKNSKTSKGVRQIGLVRAGWWLNEDSLDEPVGFYDVWGNDGVCGGASRAGALECPFMMNSSYPYHFDSSSEKFIYLK